MNAPIIAVTSDYKQGEYFLLNEYAEGTMAAGGLPVFLPYTTNAAYISGFLDHADGLLLTGGSDVNPALYGEEAKPSLGKITPERDAFEMMLTQHALKRNMPILAICRGNLMLNVAAGGTLFQDIYTEKEAEIQHKQDAPRDFASHTVQIKAESLLHQLFGSESVRVNSFHHQGINKLAPRFHVSATASDGVIEAIESPAHDFVLGVQWHPGSLIKKESHALNVFRAFVKAAQSKAE